MSEQKQKPNQFRISQIDKVWKRKRASGQAMWPRPISRVGPSRRAPKQTSRVVPANFGWRWWSALDESAFRVLSHRRTTHADCCLCVHMHKRWTSPPHKSGLACMHFHGACLQPAKRLMMHKPLRTLRAYVQLNLH